MKNRLGKKIITVGLIIGSLANATACDTAEATEKPAIVEVQPSSTSQEVAPIVLENGLSAELYPTLARKAKITEEYKQSLKENGCKEENLDFCADLLYSVNSEFGTKGVFSDQRFDLVDRTILSNYLSEEEIYNFGKTGEGLQVIYFKDENGDDTNVPAICYVGGDETENISLDELQDAINFWIDNGATNFLEAMVGNGVRVVFQNQGSSEEGGGHCVFKYGDNIIYGNSAQVDDGFRIMLTKAVAVEQYGNRGYAFNYDLGDLGILKAGVLKSRLARDCTLYMVEKLEVNNDFLFNYIKEFELENEAYMERYLPEMTNEEFEELVADVKAKNLMTPFVPVTWEEIDAVISGN